MTVKQLATSAVIPWLELNAKSYAIKVYGDPANTLQGREQLIECGFIVESALTNRIPIRIQAVNEFLDQLHNGKPRFMLARKECPKLRQGFLGKYNYERLRVIGEEKYRDEPNKTHPYSDIHDALQYGALAFKNELTDRAPKLKRSDLIKEEIF